MVSGHARKLAVSFFFKIILKRKDNPIFRLCEAMQLFTMVASCAFTLPYEK